MEVQRQNLFFEIDELLELSEYYLNNRRLDDAKLVLDYADKLYPDSMEIMINMCHLLIAQKKINEAWQIVNSAFDPTDYGIRLIEAELLLLDNNVAKAQSLLEELFKGHPDTQSRIDVAMTYCNAGFPDLAYPWAQEVLKQEPENLEALEIIACYHFSTENFEEAVKCYSRVLDEQPYYIGLWHNLIHCYLHTKEYDKALEALEFALAIDEKDLLTWELKGNYYLETNDIDSALDCFLWIEKYAIDKINIRKYIMQIYIHKSLPDKVIEYATKLLSDKENLSKEEIAETLYKKAIAYYEKGELETVWRIIAEGMELDDKIPEFHVLKGAIYLHNCRKDEAEEEFENAMKLSSQQEDVLKEIAIHYMQALEFAQAYKIFYRISRDDSDQPPFLYILMAYCWYRIWTNDYGILACIAKAYPFIAEFIDKGDLASYIGFIDQEFIEYLKNLVQKIECHEIDLTQFQLINPPNITENEKLNL